MFGARARRRLPSARSEILFEKEDPRSELYDTDGDGKIDYEEIYKYLSEVFI